MWTDVRNAYRGRNADEARSWLSTRNEALRSHLGVTFHRLLTAKRLQIDVLIDELGEALAGPGIPVMPIDPFGYATSGHPEYPKDLVARAGETKVKLTCHVWPAKSDVTGFRIGDKDRRAVPRASTSTATTACFRSAAGRTPQRLRPRGSSQGSY